MGSMVMEGPQGRVSVEDLKRMPENDRRYELCDGRLEVVPSPAPKHDRAASRLSFVLSLAAPSGYEVLSPAGLTMSAYDHRVPDVLVAPSAWIVAKPDDSLDRPAPLVVEVSSPSTRAADRTVKRAGYERFGVTSYWLVEPDVHEPRIVAFELGKDRAYREVGGVSGDEPLRLEAPFAVTIRPAELVVDDPGWKARALADLPPAASSSRAVAPGPDCGQHN